MQASPRSGRPERDQIRVARIRADAERGMSQNLRAGIALSHALLRFTGVARRPRP